MSSQRILHLSDTIWGSFYAVLYGRGGGPQAGLDEYYPQPLAWIPSTPTPRRSNPGTTTGRPVTPTPETTPHQRAA
eukprot:5755296-Pyramimonas_sp.AAC.1